MNFHSKAAMQRIQELRDWKVARKLLRMHQLALVMGTEFFAMHPCINYINGTEKININSKGPGNSFTKNQLCSILPG